MPKTVTFTDFQKAFDAAPACLGGTIDDCRTVSDLRFTVQTELDLIEEGQEAADNYTKAEVRKVRAYLNKLGGSLDN